MRHLIQGIILKSEKKFSISQQSDAIKLLTWFLDNLEREIKQIPDMRNIIDECFRGKIEIYNYKPLSTAQLLSLSPRAHRRSILG